MALEKIPLSGEVTSQITALSGTDYELDIDYNARDGKVLFDLRDDESTPLVLGMVLVPGFLLGRYEIEGLPPGDILVLSDLDLPTLESLDTGVTEVFYVTEPDLSEFRALVL